MWYLFFFLGGTTVDTPVVPTRGPIFSGEEEILFHKAVVR